MTWFDAFGLLIANGHRREDIFEYSLGEFKGYLNAAIKLHNKQLAAQLRINSLAACVPQSESGFDTVEEVANKLVKGA